MGQVGEEAEDDQHVRPHDHALEHLRPLAVAEQVATARSTPATRSPATRSARARSARRARAAASTTIARDQREDQVGLAEVAPLEASRSLHLPDPERPSSTPASTSTANRSTRNAYQPWCPSHGNVACLSTIPIIAITIVGKQHDEAPEDRGVHQPGDEPLEQLALAEHDRPPRSHAPRHVAARSTGLPIAHEPTSSWARRAKSVPLTAIAAASARRRRRRLCPRAFRISAAIAGTTSCRSPITA